MNQIVDWIGLFSDAHSVLSSFVLTLGQVLLACAPLYITYLVWKLCRRVMDYLSDYDYEHYSEAVYDDDGNYIGEDTNDGFVSADEMAEIEADAMSDLNDPSNVLDDPVNDEFFADDDFYKDGYTEEDGTEYDRFGNPV